MTMTLPPFMLWPAGMIVAALLGSFLNVCISRLPRGESIVLPASHCPLCQSPIHPADNIPLVSYVLLGGRCRACGATISWRYPVVEALAVVLGALVMWQLGPTWQALRVFLFALVMVATAFTDLETRKIPDRITLPAVGAACVLAPEGLSRGSLGAVVGALVAAAAVVLRGQPAPTDAPAPPAQEGEEELDPAERHRLDVYWAGAWGALIGRQLAVVNLAAFRASDWPLTFRILNQVDGVTAGCIVTGGLFFLVAWVSYAVLGRTGLAGGDIKLAGLIGAGLGAGGGLLAAFVGIMLGGTVAAVLLVSGRRRFGDYVPFGPFLAAGGIVAAIWGRPIMEWYLG